jgi:transposase
MNNGKVTFKEYNMQQPSLLPPSLEELIPEHHLVRVVNRVVDELDISPLLAKYKGGGTSSYHPRMMLKVIVYAYTQKIYSSRKIEKALWENIGFMWISGGNRPDFHTINNFRGSAEGICIADGVSGRRGVCEDGELLCGWDEGGREFEPTQGGLGEEDEALQGETATADRSPAG